MVTLSTFTGSWVNGLRRALLPPTCVFCGTPVDDPAGCCDDCIRHIAVIGPHHCERCGSPVPAEIAPGPCGRCLTRPPPQAKTFSLYAYAGPVRDAILSWKLEGRDAGLRWLLRTAEARLQRSFSPHDLLLPVPMPMARMRRTGQHHAADLCRAIAAITGCRTSWRILRREGSQPRQSSLSASERRRNLRRAFRLEPAGLAELGEIKGDIWIVDDILTTGATLASASRAMRPTARPIHAFSLARTPSDH